MAQIVYGIHPVKEALTSSSIAVKKVLVGTSNPSSALRSVLDLAIEKKIPVIRSDAKSLDRLASGGAHQNVLAVLEDLPYAELEDLLFRFRSENQRALFLILDGIQDPRNFGSIIRTALGCGVQGIVIPKDRAVGITPVVAKTSAGALSHMPIARVVNIAAAIEKLKAEGIWVYGAAGEAEKTLFELDFNLDLAIVLGSEGKGIRPLVKKRCDRLFSIPMEGPISSFNVSVSAGMILVEVMRQRILSGRGTKK